MGSRAGRGGLKPKTIDHWAQYETMWVITMDVDLGWLRKHALQDLISRFLPSFPRTVGSSEGSTCWELVSCLEVKTEKHPVSVGVWGSNYRPGDLMMYSDAPVFLPVPAMPAWRWWWWSDLAQPEDSQSFCWAAGPGLPGSQTLLTRINQKMNQPITFY